MSDLFDKFDTFVAEREKETREARAMLRGAVDTVEHLESSADYNYRDRARRFRDAATLARNAEAELMALAGTYELAAKVSASNMLEDGAT